MEILEMVSEGRVVPLLSDNGEKGITGETHSIEYRNQRYVMRICKDTSKVNRYVRISRLYEHCGSLPRLLGHQGKYVLYEYIEGRDLGKGETADTIRQVGEILAQVNQERNEAFSVSDVFDSHVHYLGFNEHDRMNLQRVFSNLVSANRPESRLEVSDPNPENFRIRDGKVYLVDIDSIHPDIKGAGIGKCFFKWLRSQEERRWFMEGYGRVESTEQFTDSYLKMIGLYYAITGLKIRKRHGGNPESIERLKRGLNVLMNSLGTEEIDEFNV